MNRLLATSAIVAALLSWGCHGADSKEGVRVSTVSALNDALKLAAPGDVIVWEDGEYSDLKIHFKAQGAEGSPILLRAATPGKVVLKGASQIKLSGSYLAVEGFSFKAPDSEVKDSPIMFSKGSSHCRVSDCSIDGTKSKYLDTDCKWVSMYGHHHEVSRCSFTDKRTMGCLLVVWMEAGTVPSHIIRNNYFTRPYTHYDDNGKARNGQEAIRIGTSDYSMQEGGCTVAGNWFRTCHGELAEVISNKSCGNIYEGNYFEDSQGALTLRHGNRCTVRGNYFRSTGKSDVGGVRIIGEDHVVEDNVFLDLTGSGYKSALCLVMGESNAALNGYWTVKNPVIRRNTFVDCKYGIVVNYSGRDSQDAAPENVTFEANTIVSSSNKYVSVTVIDTPESDLHWVDNVIYGGKQSGVSLPTTSVRPSVPDYTAVIESIKANSGTRW